MSTDPQHVGAAQGLLSRWPELLSWQTASVAIGSLTVAWRWIRGRRRRAAALAELLEAREERDRVTADGLRFSLSRYDEGLTPDEQASRVAVYKHDLDKARRRVWLAEGRPDPATEPDAAEIERRVLREIRRTKDRMRPIDEEQDVFAPGDKQP